MYKFILFDLDGTLTDPKLGICSAVQYALKKHGIDEPNLDKLEPFIGPPLIETFMERYDFTLEEARAATADYREYFEPKGIFENVVYDGIPELLKSLKDNGRILAVASSKPEVFVERILKHFEIYEYFNVVCGSLLNETRTKKEEVVEETLKRLSEYGEVTTGNCAMVGDRKYDVTGGKAFNLSTVAVRFGYAQGNELEEAGPDHIADTVADLGKILLSNE